MKTHLRVFAIVVFILAIGCGTASAYTKEGMHSVVLDLDGVPRMVTTDKETVGELLVELQENMDTQYVVTDAEESTSITDQMEITLASQTEKTVSTTKSTPFETVERENDEMPKGETRVVQNGVNGKVSVINKEIYHGAKLVDTVFVEEKVITEPVDKIIEIGTKIPEPKISQPTIAQQNVIDGHAYSQAFSMRATAYTPFDPGCNGITATGTKAGKGTVAVDPRVIPLGSKVYVPGYGVAVAADTGGAIKGNRLDVCYPTKNEAYSWGVRNVMVYVLK